MIKLLTLVYSFIYLHTVDCFTEPTSVLSVEAKKMYSLHVTRRVTEVTRDAIEPRRLPVLPLGYWRALSRRQKTPSFGEERTTFTQTTN